MSLSNILILDKVDGSPIEPQRALADGDWVRDTTNNSVIEYEYHRSLTITEPTPMPVLPLTNIVITNAALHGSIYWILENTAMVITGSIALPDGDYMLMAERVIDATQVVDDARFKATVLTGVMTINATFKNTGNYKFSADRLNRGLDRIGAGVHLAFEDIEFDVYV